MTCGESGGETRSLNFEACGMNRQGLADGFTTPTGWYIILRNSPECTRAPSRAEMAIYPEAGSQALIPVDETLSIHPAFVL